MQSTNKSRTVAKQLNLLPEVRPGDEPVLLAEAILDIVSFLCSEDKDVEELVNNVKPKAEQILRGAK